ncbi:MAG: hypothetical protein FWG49_01330 [Leptospirales bacterium]|nr:hypothetical protein [Leptospirales bacterium]
MRKKLKDKLLNKDDTLFGLLLPYKQNNTYVRVLLNEDVGELVVALTENPKFWINLPSEITSSFRSMKRLEINAEKMFIKYISPEQLIRAAGATAGINLAMDKIKTENLLDEKGYYLVKTSTRYLNRVLSSIKKLLSLSPSKKYEIIEKCIPNEQGQ